MKPQNNVLALPIPKELFQQGSQLYIVYEALLRQDLSNVELSNEYHVLDYRTVVYKIRKALKAYGQLARFLILNTFLCIRQRSFQNPPAPSKPG